MVWQASASFSASWPGCTSEINPLHLQAARSRCLHQRLPSFLNPIHGSKEAAASASRMQRLVSKVSAPRNIFEPPLSKKSGEAGHASNT